jgi:hypothetical protein
VETICKMVHIGQHGMVQHGGPCRWVLPGPALSAFQQPTAEPRENPFLGSSLSMNETLELLEIPFSIGRQEGADVERQQCFEVSSVRLSPSCAPERQRHNG